MKTKVLTFESQATIAAGSDYTITYRRSGNFYIILSMYNPVLENNGYIAGDDATANKFASLLGKTLKSKFVFTQFEETNPTYWDGSAWNFSDGIVSFLTMIEVN